MHFTLCQRNHAGDPRTAKQENEMNAASHSRSRITIAVVALSAVVLASVSGAFNLRNPARAQAADEGPAAQCEASLGFNSDGELIRPEGYRRWIFVGTPLTPNDMNGGTAAFPQFQNVYIDPEAFAEYETTGEFPDGTALVKELVSVGSKAATSGKGYFMGDFIGLEVAVKDSTRFKSEPGHWAYFSFGHEYPLKDTVEPQPVANCSTCHGASAAQDFVFTQYYPVLRAAKPAASKRQ